MGVQDNVPKEAGSCLTSRHGPDACGMCCVLSGTWGSSPRRTQPARAGVTMETRHGYMSVKASGSLELYFWCVGVGEALTAVS